MYLVDGRRYTSGDHTLERALGGAYERGARPLCLCSRSPVPVYVARMGETFVLKRMPFTGSRHAAGCPHHEPPAGQLLGRDSAISQHSATGLTHLRVAFAMSQGKPRPVGSGRDHDGESIGSGSARLSLCGLLLFLWREAELTKWRPGFEGKRSWAVVRRHLLSAASNKVVAGLPLADVLYVPEVFSVNDAEAIRSRRERLFDQGFRRLTRGKPNMILIAELKEIVPTRLHFKVIIKHVPDVPFLLSTDLHRRMTLLFTKGLALWEGDAETRLIIAATFALAEWGQPAIEELCLVPTSSHWLLVNDDSSKRLVDRLVAERRSFDEVVRSANTSSSFTVAAMLDGMPASLTTAQDRKPGRSRHSIASVVP